jgi:hypothetical protein
MSGCARADDGQRGAEPARAECGLKDTGPAEKLFQGHPQARPQPTAEVGRGPVVAGAVLCGHADPQLARPRGLFGIAPEYWLWIWPRDLNEAIGRLNLVPYPRLVGAQ